MEKLVHPVLKKWSDRRSFLRNGAVAAGAVGVGAALLPDSVVAFDDDDNGGPVTKGDIAILTFRARWNRWKPTCGSSMPNWEG
jgi:hypothetical protein